MQLRMVALTSSCKSMHKKVAVVRCKKLSYAQETYDKTNMCIQMSQQKEKGNFDRLYCIYNVSANIRLLRFVDIMCWSTRHNMWQNTE